MGTFTASDITSKEAVKAVHAGLNSRVFTYTLDETASSALTIAMGRLPGGARVQGLELVSNVDQIGTGTEKVCVYDNLGNTYIKTTTFSIRMGLNNYAGLNARLTSSAHLTIQLIDCVKTGTASMKFALAVNYIREDSPD